MDYIVDYLITDYVIVDDDTNRFIGRKHSDRWVQLHEIKRYPALSRIKNADLYQLAYWFMYLEGANNNPSKMDKLMVIYARLKKLRQTATDDEINDINFLLNL
jgi:hypothetical protein